MIPETGGRAKLRYLLCVQGRRAIEAERLANGLPYRMVTVPACTDKYMKKTKKIVKFLTVRQEKRR